MDMQVETRPREVPLLNESQDHGVIPGLVWAFHIRDDGTAEALSVEEPIVARHDGWLWLHLNLTELRGLRLPTSLALPPPAMSLLLSHDNHQQLHAADDCLYGVFADLVRNLDGPSDEVANLHFAMTERVLVSGRRHALCSVDAARTVIEGGGRRLGTVAELLELVVEHVADAMDRLADRICIELDGIEDVLTTHAPRDERKRLARLRRTSVTLHRQLAGLRTVFHRLEREGTDNLRPPLRVAAGKLAQRLDALDHDIIEMRDRAWLLQEEIGTILTEESNRSLNILTVITTLVLPPTLVTGVFGMNTKGLPFTDDPDAFLWACALMAGSVILAAVLMKRIGVLKF